MVAETDDHIAPVVSSQPQAKQGSLQAARWNDLNDLGWQQWLRSLQPYRVLSVYRCNRMQNASRYACCISCMHMSTCRWYHAGPISSYSMLAHFKADTLSAVDVCVVVDNICICKLKIVEIHMIKACKKWSCVPTASMQLDKMAMRNLKHLQSILSRRTTDGSAWSAYSQIPGLILYSAEALRDTCMVCYPVK